MTTREEINIKQLRIEADFNFAQYQDAGRLMFELQAVTEQQAEAIRLKDAALTVAEDFVDRHSEKWYASGQRDLQQIREAMLIQPSPEILQARDKRVAEACAKVCIEQSEGIARSTPVSRDYSESSVRESAFRIRNGAWERHL